MGLLRADVRRSFLGGAESLRWQKAAARCANTITVGERRISYFAETGCAGRSANIRSSATRAQWRVSASTLI